MKKLFRKKQVVITALSIMIVIAGYLGFTNNVAQNDKNSVQTSNPVIDESASAELEGPDVVSETGDTDTTTDETMDEDLLDDTEDVDNGGVLGEAVLINTLDGGNLISYKVEREQVRAKNKASYMEIIESEDVSEEVKKEAVNAMIELTAIAEKESAAEMLLEAKGFDGAVVVITDGEVDVVVNAESLSDQQLATIEDVVKKKTDISVEHISITPVVAGD